MMLFAALFLLQADAAEPPAPSPQEALRRANTLAASGLGVTAAGAGLTALGISMFGDVLAPPEEGEAFGYATGGVLTLGVGAVLVGSLVAIEGFQQRAAAREQLGVAITADGVAIVGRF